MRRCPRAPTLPSPLLTGALHIPAISLAPSTSYMCVSTFISPEPKQCRSRCSRRDIYTQVLCAQRWCVVHPPRSLRTRLIRSIPMPINTAAGRIQLVFLPLVCVDCSACVPETVRSHLPPCICLLPCQCHLHSWTMVTATSVEYNLAKQQRYHRLNAHARHERARDTLASSAQRSCAYRRACAFSCPSVFLFFLLSGCSLLSPLVACAGEEPLVMLSIPIPIHQFCLYHCPSMTLVILI